MRCRALAVVTLVVARACLAAELRADPDRLLVVPPADASELERYAAEELARFLQPITLQKVRLGTGSERAAAYVLVAPPGMVPPALAEEEIVLSSTQWNGAPAVVVGGGRRAVLHAAYTLLERLGYLFEFSGHRAPTRRRRLELSGIELRATPSIKRRGLRLHLNFPMDQSSYSLPEWLGWIDRMARLRLNAVIFHFYASHPWLEFEYAGKTPAGQDFFAGRGAAGGAYLLPPHLPGRHRIQNRRRYAPPELEDLAPSRELYRRTRERLRRVMAHARARGLRCIVALEPRAPPRLPLPELEGRPWSDELKERLAVPRVEALLDSYPDAEEVQLISTEGSHDAPADHQAQDRLLQEIAARHSLSPELLVPATSGDGRQVAVATLRYFDSARRVLETPHLARRLAQQGKDVSIALYLPGLPAALLPALLRIVPAGAGLHLLPGYGARTVSDQIGSWSSLQKAPLPVSVITWLEFDGSMFLPQTWTRALYDGALAAHALPVAGLYANHWRVSGLEADARVFAETAWDAGTPYEGLLERYLSRVYGRPALPAALEAHARLEQVSLLAASRLFNIGFNWEPYQHRPYPEEALEQARRGFAGAASAYEALARRADAEYGRRRALLLANRCRAAILHLEAVQHLALALQTRSSKGATAPEIALAVERCRRAAAAGREYLRTYAERVDDRGDQGMLVNYYYAIVHRAEGLARELRAME